MTIPRPSKAARRSSGFTLIEVMIALVVLLVGLLGLARLQVVGMQVNQASRAHTVAAQLAQELAGGLQRLDWDDGQVAPDGGGRKRSAAGLRDPARERRVRHLPFLERLHTGPRRPAGLGHHRA